ncbi:MAG: hypothetical protein CVV44_08770 [Spirochaetae bacterium HGW-Spirochaetae-1]|nr:MAG: hypothetical protein CVV44_08770 [Spirochaetae bacterium HGW-Spirochaetae-1]
MNFAAVLLIAFLITVTMKTYRRIYSLSMAVALLFGLTTAALLYGLNKFQADPSWSIIGQGITKNVYLHFMALWYAFDIICSAIIIRRYIKYLKLNNLPPFSRQA